MSCACSTVRDRSRARGSSVVAVMLKLKPLSAVVIGPARLRQAVQPTRSNQCDARDRNPIPVGYHPVDIGFVCVVRLFVIKRRAQGIYVCFTRVRKRRLVRKRRRVVTTARSLDIAIGVVKTTVNTYLNDAQYQTLYRGYRHIHPTCGSCN